MNYVFILVAFHFVMPLRKDTLVLHKCYFSVAGSPKPKSIIVQPQNSHEVYDELCFDSSESEGEDDQAGSTRYVGKKVSKLSNDELFYDPGLDDEDERWVNRQRMAYHNGWLPMLAMSQ